MSYLRRFLFGLALLLALAAVCVSALFIPAVQTSLAQRQLDQHPALHASLGAVSAGVGSLEARELSLELGGAALIVPSLQAELPVVRAFWHHDLSIRRLIAKGWTLDLGGPVPPKNSPTAPPARPAGANSSAANPIASIPAIATQVFHRLLAGWELPSDVLIDAVELEGDVLLPAQLHTDPIAVHVVIKGGGLSAGREGSFDLTTTFPLINDAGYLIAMITTHGQLTLTTTPDRRPSRIELVSDLSAKGRALPDGLRLAVALTAADQTHNETYSVSLKCRDRFIAAITAHSPPTTAALAGTWTLDLRDSDLPDFFPKAQLPAVAAAGAGTFDADADFTRVRATGQLIATGRGLAAPFDRLGAATLHADFDLEHSAHSLHIDRLTATLGDALPVATVRALQSFTVDEQSGRLHTATPTADWLEGSLTDLPLVRILGSDHGVTLSGGAVRGEFFVRADGEKFSIRSKAPLTARGVAVQNGSAVLVRDIDLTFPLLAEVNRDAWRATASPITIERAGQRLATIETTATQPLGTDQPIKITGKWKAVRDGTGGSAAGEFSALAGAWFTADTSFTATGRDPANTLAAKLHVNADTNGRVTFLAPITIALGARKAEVTAEGSWSQTSAGGHATLALTSDNVSLDHLALLATPFTSITDTPDARDSSPFWGHAIGRVSFDFAHLQALGHAFSDVGGTLFLDDKTLRLEGGRGVFRQDRHARIEGALTFDASAGVPYAARATAAVDEIDAALLVGPTSRGREPLLRGRFAVTSTLTGTGASLADLVRHTQEEFRLTSAGGSTNLLQTSVANSLTEAPTPVKDALGSVGSVFGALLKTKANILQAEKNPLSKNTEAVLNFTYATAEFRYDRLAITAVRDATGAIRLTDFTLTAPNERLTGTGEIAGTSRLPLAQRPLSLILQIGLRGPPAKFLVEAGLLPAAKDSADYAPLAEPVHFGGTLADVDRGAWRDLLVTAAAPPKTTPAKKSN